jgi:hypothetical protein
MRTFAQDWPAAPSTVTTEDIDFKLDRLLSEWYEWRRSYRFTRGYAGRDATCRDYRTPGHWDWRNGAEDARGDELLVKAVDKAVDRIPNSPERWNTALQFEAMNLHSGRAVWTSPMLPRDRAEREVLVMEARTMLLTELRRAGVMG